MPITLYSGALVPECYMLLVAPDWGTAPEIAYRVVTDQAEGGTGIEDRATESRALRLRLTASWQLSAAETVALRTALANLEDRRWGLPLAPDSDVSSWIHAPQRRVSWTDAGTVAVLAPGDAVPHPHVAPLLIARLVRREEIAVQGGAHYAVALTFEEDAPWDCRIDPAAGTVPTDWEWDPDYTSDPVDRSRDQLREVQLGGGRELGIAGADGTPRWGQAAAFTLQRAQIAALLRFFLDRRGSTRAFEVPSWCRPGADTPQQPHTLTARFDKDVLTIRYETPWWARLEVALWQEVALEEGTQEQAQRAMLYTFSQDGGSTVRLTSCEHALTTGGHTWTPARVEHRDHVGTLTLVGDACEIAVFAGEQNHPLRAALAGEAERRLFVTVTEAVLDASGAVTTTTEIFSGEVRSVQHSGDALVARAAAFGAVFSRVVPRFYVQRGCNYVLFDSCCTLAKAAHVRTGPVGGTLPSATVTFTPSAAPTGDYAAKWFAGGWLEVTGTDGQFHRRAVLDCSVAAGVWTLKLNRSLPATCAGQSASAYPGCDGNYSTCGAKFANADNFGGHPFVPDFISTSDGAGAAAKVK